MGKKWVFLAKNTKKSPKNPKFCRKLILWPQNWPDGHFFFLLM